MADISYFPCHARAWRLVSRIRQLKEPPEGPSRVPVTGAALRTVIAGSDLWQSREAGLAQAGVLCSRRLPAVYPSGYCVVTSLASVIGQTSRPEDLVARDAEGTGNCRCSGDVSLESIFRLLEIPAHCVFRDVGKKCELLDRDAKYVE